MKKVIIAVLMLTVASGAAGFSRMKAKTKPAPRPDVKAIILKMLPKGWKMEVTENASPTLWRANMACVGYKLTNPTVTHKHEIGGFDYSPFHDFWVCPVDYNGVQNQIGMVEQKYPARYVADGDAGILFHLSLGDNDWGSAVDDLVKALALEKPAMKQAECDKVQAALRTIVDRPKGINLMCSMTTASSVFVSLFSVESDDIQEINLWTDAAGKAVKKAFPNKTRVVVTRRFDMNDDAVIMPFKPKIR